MKPSKRFLAQPSFIRNILTNASQEGVISFAGGLPDERLMNHEGIYHAMQKLMNSNGTEWMQYGVSEGDFEVRRRIAQGLGDIAPEAIIVTSGSQQGLDLIGKAFFEAEMVIGVESPSYVGALQSFLAYGVCFKAIPLQKRGVDLNALEEAFKEGCRWFYMVPDFQNPTGSRYDLYTRKEVARLARKYDVTLIEDRPYAALDYSNTPLPSIASFAPERTLMLGSFSKTLMPGLRIGYLYAPKAYKQTLLIAKEATDLHTNRLSQQLLLTLLEEQSHHIEHLKTHYCMRREWMIDALKNTFKCDIDLKGAEGGMFLWVEFSKKVNTMEWFQRAITKGVAFVPGEVFSVDTKNHQNAMRLNFTRSSKVEIEEGMLRLLQSF